MHLFHRTFFAALLPALLVTALGISAPARAAEPRVALQFHAAQAPHLRSARLLGRLATSAPLRLALTLPLRNQDALNTLLQRQATPGDALYGHFLTSDEFNERFGPTEADYQAVADWARSQGLVITGTHPGRTVLDVAGSSAHVESAFGIHLNRYQVEDGRVVYANSAAPSVPRSIAARLAGVAGLSSLSQMQPQAHWLKPWKSGVAALRPNAATTAIGTGPAGGLSPNDIKFAYNLATVTPLYGSILGTGSTATSSGGAGVSSGTLNGTSTGTTTSTGTNTGTTTSTGTNTGGNSGVAGTGTNSGVTAEGIVEHVQERASTAGTATPTLLDGTGQSLGLFELYAYQPSDIALFVNQYSLPTVLPVAATATAPAVVGTVQPVSVDQFNVNQIPTVSQAETTLDIEMMLALAPKAAGIYSFEGDQGTAAAPNPAVAIDIFQQMADAKATDGSGKPLLQVINCSYGVPEEDQDPAIATAENVIFQKMAAQGQSVFCGTGDQAAFPRYPLSLQPSVFDPASQPFVTAVGGTTLSYNKPTVSTTTGATIPGSYGGEIVWKTGTINNPPTPLFPTGGPEGGGGGSSVFWPKPNYQAGLGASPLRRDIPDVALNADLATGYDIFFLGKIYTGGGTSAATPLWAAFAALVNEQRGLNGLTTTLGFANPPLYSLGRSTAYTTVFHDITVGDNLLYEAQPGYDDASGFGSFIGDQLIAALSGNPDQGTGTATLTGTVTDNASPANPVAGVTVTAKSVSTGTVKATATTDAGGAYTLTVPSGLALTVTVDTSTIAAGATNYAAPAPVTLTLTAGTTTTLPFTLTAAHTFAAGLQMISAPYDFSSVGDFAAEFGLATPLANPNPRLIQWEPLLSSYVFYPTAPADMLRPGQGYWIKFPTANYLHRLGATVPTTQAFQETLQPGWNQIGDPFLVSVPLSSLTADTVPSSGAVAITAATSPIQSTLYAYNQATNGYVKLDPTLPATPPLTIDPFVGYWIFAKQTAVLSIPAPSGGVPPPPSGGVPPPP